MQYLKFLISFAEYDPKEPHTEAFIRRIFSILNSLILQGKITVDIVKEIVPLFFDKMEHLINLRYNNEACVAFALPAKGS